jgi:hypothetical protein
MGEVARQPLPRAGFFEKIGFVRFNTPSHRAIRICGIVYENTQKLREAAANVFVESRRDCVDDLFSRASAFDSVISDIEEWVSDIREAMDSLEKIRPGRTALLDDRDD